LQQFEKFNGFWLFESLSVLKISKFNDFVNSKFSVNGYFQQSNELLLLLLLFLHYFISLQACLANGNDSTIALCFLLVLTAA